MASSRHLPELIWILMGSWTSPLAFEMGASPFGMDKLLPPLFEVAHPLWTTWLHSFRFRTTAAGSPRPTPWFMATH